MVILTPRQREVLRLIAEGYTIKAAAKQLGISPRTVETHLANIRIRLRASNTIQAVALYTKSHRKENNHNG